MPLVVDNKVIKTPIKNILERLQEELVFANINKLSKISFKGNEAIIQCPRHKGGQENNPSCGVLLEDKVCRDYTGKKREVPAGTVHCFSCGYKAGMVKLIADCLGTTFREATEWLLGFADYEYADESRNIYTLDFSVEPPVYADVPRVTVEELKKYDYIHPYMFQRKLTDEVIQKFEVGYDPATDSLTFPVYVDGECLFVSRRKVKYKYFSLPDISPKPLYGVDYLTDNEVIVCESVINALTCWVYGKQAIALFGTGSDYQIEKLQELPQRKIILALDPDIYGERGAKKIRRALTGKIVTQYVLPKGKDINDLTKEEFEKLKEI